jgi:hypothetical protein
VSAATDTRLKFIQVEWDESRHVDHDGASTIVLMSELHTFTDAAARDLRIPTGRYILLVGDRRFEGNLAHCLAGLRDYCRDHPDFMSDDNLSVAEAFFRARYQPVTILSSADIEEATAYLEREGAKDGGQGVPAANQGDQGR